MNRVYHPWQKWEDHKSGFYNPCSGQEKEQKIKKVLELFNDVFICTDYMNRVINEWTYSCEHNLTNPSLNKIAYIGQAACCIYDKIPSSVTMEAWSLLDKKTQERADKIAGSVLKKWENKNKNIQLCLNID